MKMLRLHQQGGVEKEHSIQSSQTRRIPTATQTMAFANTSATIIPTAGHGSFRIPGIRIWQATTRLLTTFFSARIPILTNSSDPRTPICSRWSKDFCILSLGTRYGRLLFRTYVQGCMYIFEDSLMGSRHRGRG